MNQANEYFSNLGNVTVASLQNVWFNFLQYLPNIVGAIVILIVGWIVASVLGRVVRKVVSMTGVDAAVDRSGINERLHFSRNYHLLSRALGALVKWFVIIATLVAIAGVLNLPQITQFLSEIVNYIPRVIVAVAILTIGVLAASFVENLITRGLNASRLPMHHQKLLGQIAKYAIIVFSVMTALVQLNIVPQLIEILFGGLVLALALAFGLGGREEAARLLQSLREER